MTTKRRFGKHKRSSGLSFKALVVIFSLLGSVTVFTPIVTQVIDEARVTARKLAFDAGFVDPETCVVTSAYAIDCTKDAVGTPLREALANMQSQQAELAAESLLRSKAESAARQTAAEIAQLRAHDAASMTRSTQQQTDRTPSPSTTGPNVARSGDAVPTTVARTKPPEEEVLPVTVMPNEGDAEGQSYFPAEQSEAQ